MAIRYLLFVTRLPSPGVFVEKFIFKTSLQGVIYIMYMIFEPLVVIFMSKNNYVCDVS